MEDRKEYCPDCGTRMTDLGIVNGFEFIDEGTHVFKNKKYEARECQDDGILTLREIGLMTDD